MSNSSKPKALAIATPFEGRSSYLMAGLSFHYDLDFYFFYTPRFRFNQQIFYRDQYSDDCHYRPFTTLKELLDAADGYDTIFIFPSSLTPFFGWYESQEEILEFILKMKEKGKKIVWLDLGEMQYQLIGRPKFWDNIDYCLKGQVFKKEFEYILKDQKKVSLFNGKDVMESEVIIKENAEFDLEKYRHKILPFPFTPSITKQKDLDFDHVPKIYDISANTRTGGNGALRCSIIKLIQSRLPDNYNYSFDYDEQGVSSNLPMEQRHADWSIKMGKVGKTLFRLKYLNYFYPSPLYMHNLSKSRTYLGLGWTFSSLRTADCWGAGTVLINFSFNKCDYGVPVEDGYNYVSIGERDEMTEDNEHLTPGFEDQIYSKVSAILGDKKKQQEIAKNGKKTYEDYFSSPQQFVKKIFIDKIS